jgi:hypothetical protein
MDKRERHELPIDEKGNGERLKTLTFDFADAAMLYHAVLIGKNTVMMCGGGKATDRMQYYERMFREACPPGYQHFRREEDLANIAIAMMDADACLVKATRRYQSSDEHEVDVIIGKRKWNVSRLGNDQLTEIVSCLKAIAPMNCEVNVEEEVTSRW